MLDVKREYLKYKVGTLMYVPALNSSVQYKLCRGDFSNLNSLAFCLEDTINDNSVTKAEIQLFKKLEYISNNCTIDIPLLFVRVRNTAQYQRLIGEFGKYSDILTGIILPKFDLINAQKYCEISEQFNREHDRELFIMPTLESHRILNLETRKNELLELKKILSKYSKNVLNIRVGAMDFCKHYGLRRSIDQTIYDIALVRDVLSDILVVFSENFIVSAPVCEYFESDNKIDYTWQECLKKEVLLDISNGFVGKTIIHPSQIDVVKNYSKPLKMDFEDANALINWKDKELKVAKNFSGNRMNEVSTHLKWAQKVLRLAEVYGIREA